MWHYKNLVKRFKKVSFLDGSKKVEKKKYLTRYLLANALLTAQDSALLTVAKIAKFCQKNIMFYVIAD